MNDFSLDCFRLMERFQGDYDSMVQSHCMRVFGLPECETGKDKRFIGLESFPRVAEVYIQGMSKVSSILYIIFFTV